MHMIYGTTFGLNILKFLRGFSFKKYFFCDQLDGRPMSGDIGRGATRETVSFAIHMASVPERPPGKQSKPLE